MDHQGEEIKERFEEFVGAKQTSGSTLDREADMGQQYQDHSNEIKQGEKIVKSLKTDQAANHGGDRLK